MERLQQLALVESLKEIDQSGKHMCIETLGADCVASFLKNIFQNGSGEERKKWLNAVGSSFDEYLDYSHMVNRMGTSSVRELEDAVGRVKFHRGRFCEFIHASRDEACSKPYAYTTRGEFGGETGYFRPVRWDETTLGFVEKEDLTEEEKGWLDEYPECVYQSGRPCARWEDEDGADEDCECVLGREYYSLVLVPLGDESNDDESDESDESM